MTIEELIESKTKTMTDLSGKKTKVLYLRGKIEIEEFKQQLLIVGYMCPTHKPNLKDSYVQWHDWAESQAKKGIKQTQCEKCKRWFFSSEL